MTTHQYGIDEREAKNNHGTCWVMQVAEFARHTGRDDLTAYCRDRYKTVLLPNQVAADGSFPEELRRTKPYGYSLFNLDAMATLCQILSTGADNLWTYELPDGRGIRKAVAFMVPYIADKKTWPYKPDVMYHDEWPMRHPALLFAGLALGEQTYFDLWKRLPADSDVDEVIRNFFVRQPLLWVEWRRELRDTQSLPRVDLPGAPRRVPSAGIRPSGRSWPMSSCVTASAPIRSTSTSGPTTCSAMWKSKAKSGGRRLRPRMCAAAGGATCGRSCRRARTIAP